MTPEIEVEVGARIDVIAKARSKGMFVAKQPLTPFLLVDEITQQLRLDGKISVCVFYTVEWAIYLRVVAGVKDITVAVQDHDPVVKKLCDYWGFKYLSNILYMTNPPKFDVVVGNPPYRNAENSSFYTLFVTKAKSLANIVAFVVPSSQFKDTTEFKNLRAYSFKGKAFVGVQLIVSWFVWERNYTGGCRVRFLDGGELTSDQFSVAPTASLDAFKLANRLLSQALPGFDINMGQLSRNKVRLDQDGIKCIWSAGKKGQDFDFAMISRDLESQLAGVSSHKVVFSGDYTTTAIGQIKYAPPGVGCALKAHFIEVSSEAEAKVLIEFLNSKLVRAIVPVIKGTSTKNGKTVFKLLPKVDLTRSWTDAELYAHFGLTEEEIAYVEKPT